jgi:hypothetical protein
MGDLGGGENRCSGTNCCFMLSWIFQLLGKLLTLSRAQFPYLKMEINSNDLIVVLGR